MSYAGSVGKSSGGGSKGAKALAARITADTSNYQRGMKEVNKSSKAAGTQIKTSGDISQKVMDKLKKSTDDARASLLDLGGSAIQTSGPMELLTALMTGLTEMQILFWVSVATKTVDGAKKFAGAVNDGCGKANESFKNFSDDTKKWAGDTGSTITKWGNDTRYTIDHWGNDQAGKFNKWKDDTGGVINKWGGDTGGKLHDWAGTVNKDFDDFKNDAGNTIRNWGTAAGADIGNFKTDAGGSITNWSTTAQGDISDFAGKINTDAVGALDGIKNYDYGGIASNIKTDLAGAWDTFIDDAGKAKDAIGGLFQKAKDGASGAADNLKKWLGSITT